jgi:hypothetical protein
VRASLGSLHGRTLSHPKPTPSSRLDALPARRCDDVLGDARRRAVRALACARREPSVRNSLAGNPRPRAFSDPHSIQRFPQRGNEGPQKSARHRHPRPLLGGSR